MRLDLTLDELQRSAADIRAHNVGGEILRGAMQPAGKNGAVGELGRALGQGGEGSLRHVLGQMRIADHAQGRGIDEVEVAAHQLDWLSRFQRSLLSPAQPSPLLQLQLSQKPLL